MLVPFRLLFDINQLMYNCVLDFAVSGINLLSREVYINAPGFPVDATVGKY